MQRRLWVVLPPILLLLLLVAPPAAAGPRAVVRTSRDAAIIEFPERVTFSARLLSDIEIKNVVLEYGVEQLTCGQVVARAFPEFEPFTQVPVEWTWEMRQSGSLPPGARIWWRWHTIDAAGQEAWTERQEVTWLDDVHDWQTVSGGGIHLHWYEGGAEFGRELHASAVQSLADLAESTGLHSDSPIDLYIYGSGDDLQAAVLYEPGWTGGLAYAEHGIVIIGIAPTDIDWGKETIAHELTHVLAGRLTFTCLGEVPTWLQEGLAVYGEGGLDEVSQQLFDRAVAENKLLSVRALSGGFSEDPAKADISYSESYSLVRFLIERYGTERILALLDALRRGATVEKAMQSVYGLTLEQFEDDWRAAIGAQPRPRGSGPPTLTPTPTMVPTYVPVAGNPPAPPSGPTRAASTPASTAALAGTPQVTGPTPTPAVSPTPVQALAIAGGILVGVTVIIVLVLLLFGGRKKKPPTMLLLLLPLLLALIGACGPTPIPPASTTAPPTAIPSSPMAYPPRPTVTPYVAPTSAPGTFSDATWGVSLDLPAGWTTAPGEDEYTVSWFYSPDEAISALLVGDIMPEGYTLAEIAAEVNSGMSSGLTNTAILRDGPLVLGDGREAWQIVSLGDNVNGERFKVNVVTTAAGGRLFIFLAGSHEDDYNVQEGAIAVLVQGLRFTTPTPYGLPRQGTLFLAGSESTNPRDHDPATTHGSGDKLVFSGLVSFDPQLNLVPELAESWQVSGGTVYTFTLRANARFHNGRPVTAQDIVYSWERAADPDTASDTVLTYLGDIVGVQEMKEGQAEHIAGLQVIDDHTLQVTIDAPKPYFLLKLTYPTAFVLDRDNVESGKEWYRTPNGTGPYRLTRWEPLSLKLYEANTDFYLEPPAIAYVLVKLYQGVAVRLYESGEIDIAGVSSRDVPRVLDPNDPLHADVRSAVNLCTSYVTFDVAQPPFEDVKVRQAFAMAFDRQQYLDVVLHGIGLPAQGIFPPGLPGYNADLRGIPYDPEGARRLLAESSYGGPEGLPPIVFTDGGYGSDIGADVAALAQMWRQTLGVTITVENLEPNRFLDEIYAGNHGQIFSLGWCADYPDPENLADILFHSGSQQNKGHYSNPQVDALLEQARVEPDVEKRLALYQQAEQMIVDDAPVIFTTHSVSYVLVKPYVLGYALTPVDVPLERYLRIDPQQLR